MRASRAAAPSTGSALSTTSSRASSAALLFAIPAATMAMDTTIKVERGKTTTITERATTAKAIRGRTMTMTMKAKATTGKATRATETILAEERMGRGRAMTKVGLYLRNYVRI
jgi:hypothetical protein